MRRLRSFLTVGLLALGLVGMLTAPMVAHADTPKQVVCSSIGAGSDCAEDPNSGVTVNKIIQVTLNILSIVVGVAAVIMIMVSGFKYITAGGDASKVSSAKNTLIYAIVGIAIVALSQFIVQFVFSKVTATPPARQPAKENSFLVPSQGPLHDHGYVAKGVLNKA